MVDPGWSTQVLRALCLEAWLSKAHHSPINSWELTDPVEVFPGSLRTSALAGRSRPERRFMAPSPSGDGPQENVGLLGTDPVVEPERRPDLFRPPNPQPLARTWVCLCVQ